MPRFIVALVLLLSTTVRADEPASLADAVAHETHASHEAVLAAGLAQRSRLARVDALYLMTRGQRESSRAAGLAHAARGLHRLAGVLRRLGFAGTSALLERRARQDDRVAVQAE